MAIKILKLVNGDDIICELISTTKGEYIVKKALRLVEDYNPDKKSHNIFLIQWLPYTDELTITIPKSVLISQPIEPLEEMQEHYEKRVPEIFYDDEREYQMTEEDIMLLQDFEESMGETPDEDETIH